MLKPKHLQTLLRLQQRRRAVSISYAATRSPLQRSPNTTNTTTSKCSKRFFSSTEAEAAAAAAEENVAAPTTAQLRRHFFKCAVPMVGFGFMDQTVMLQVSWLESLLECSVI